MCLFLTALFTQHKKQLGGAVLDICVYVRHQAHQLVPEGVAHLWPIFHIPKRREHLRSIVSPLATAKPHRTR